MPITRAKMFSLTNTVTVEWLGETAEVVWSPLRWTGEMQDFADSTRAELEEVETAMRGILDEAKAAEDEAAALEGADGDAALIAELRVKARTLRADADYRNSTMSHRSTGAIREALSNLIVSWDVLDDGTPLATDVGTLKTLPDYFLVKVWLALFEENQPDPPKAPDSDEPSTSPREDSAPSPIGTSSSDQPELSESPPSSSTSEPTERAITPPGEPGR